MAGVGRSLMMGKERKAEAGLSEASQTVAPRSNLILRPQDVFGGL